MHCSQYTWRIVQNWFQRPNGSQSVFGVATGATCSAKIAGRKEKDNSSGHALTEDLRSSLDNINAAISFLSKNTTNLRQAPDLLGIKISKLLGGPHGIRRAWRW